MHPKYFSQIQRNYAQLNLIATLKIWQDRNSGEVNQTSREQLCVNKKNQKQHISDGTSDFDKV